MTPKTRVEANSSEDGNDGFDGSGPRSNGDRPGYERDCRVDTQGSPSGKVGHPYCLPSGPSRVPSSVRPIVPLPWDGSQGLFYLRTRPRILRRPTHLW